METTTGPLAHSTRTTRHPCLVASGDGPLPGLLRRGARAAHAPAVTLPAQEGGDVPRPAFGHPGRGLLVTALA
jgi:hypothetical protein